MICNFDVVCLHWIEVRNKVLEGKRKSVLRVFKCMCVYVVCVCVHGVCVCMDHRLTVMVYLWTVKQPL